MGLFTNYVVYKSIKRKKAIRNLETRLVDMGSICSSCGHTLAQHADDDRRSCPTYKN